ncbi:GUN4 domain-containing protein [Halomicronema hongdechloris]|uniref:GUN4 domain-containing protein n=1 Tax=Halomicronema hongdechloris TaxID=1209493 RepID=UPI0016516D85|nr:GUN4 domain-containing protein [Halomicronema hongdechloris]
MFRLRVFIADNTGLFNQVTHPSGAIYEFPLTLEQLSKFTALCIKYPLLRVDLEKDETLLSHLQKRALYAGTQDTSNNGHQNDANGEQIASDAASPRVEYWINQPQLAQLLRLGCDTSKGDDNQWKDTYSFETVDIKKLLQVSPQVLPIDRVGLRSEKGVDYRRLRAYLRAKRWREADEETYRVMLKAADREEQEYLDIDDIKRFPCADLQTIDGLWVTASNDRFGFSVQKQIWIEVGGKLDFVDGYSAPITAGNFVDLVSRGFYDGLEVEDRDAVYAAYEKMSDRNGWRVNGEYIRYSQVTFDTSAPDGHLPRGHLQRVKGVGFGRGGVLLVVPSLASRLVNCSR